MAFVGGARPSTVQAATTYNYVSSLDIAQSIHKPEIDPEFVRRYGDQNLTGFMEMMGYMNPISAIEYHHFEEDWLHESLQATGAGAGPGVTAVYTPVGAHGPTTNDPYQQADQDAPYRLPRLNDLVMFTDRTIGIITDVNPGAPSFDVTPVDINASCPTVAATDEIVIIGNAHEERSGQPESRNGRVLRYTNNLMIKKSTNTVSGTEAGVQTWVELQDENGQSGYLWYFESGYQEYRRFMNECEMTMLLGEQVTNTNANIGATTTVSEGLIPFIENFGNELFYSTITGFTLADLDNLVKTLDRERGSKENTIWAGINLSLGIDDTFIDLFQDGAVSYGAFGGMQDMAVGMQFSSIKRGNYVFHKKTYDLFNYQKTLGATGMPFPDYALVIPGDNTVEGKTKQSVPSMRMNYLQGKGNNYSRDMEEWLTGGANGVYNTDVDEVNVHYRAHRGFEGFAPNRFAILKPL